MSKIEQVKSDIELLRNFFNPCSNGYLWDNRLRNNQHRNSYAQTAIFRCVSLADTLCNACFYDFEILQSSKRVKGTIMTYGMILAILGLVALASGFYLIIKPLGEFKEQNKIHKSKKK